MTTTSTRPARSRSHSLGRWLTLGLALGLATGCDDGDATTADMAALEDMGGADAMPDAMLDAMPDAMPDLGPPPPAPFTADALLGTWSGVACEPTLGEFLTRQITFTEDGYTVFGGVFDDRDCTQMMSSFEQIGTYEITSGSPLGDNVVQATFRLEHVYWTVHQEGLLPGFDLNDCGEGDWAVDTPQDIVETGCLGFIYPREACPGGELEVLRLDGDLITTGERPLDICAERAPRVGDFPLQRVPDVVEIDAPQFYPEGVALGPDRTLYVGAFTTGEIRRAPFAGATAETLVEPGALGGAALGLKVHDGALWACVTDLAAPENSALVRLDPATGAEQARHPLPGGGICNDMIFADDGTAYVTESSRNDVLRLTPDADALEVWFTGDALPPVGGMGYGFNGLVIADDGSLLVGRVDDGTLTRIPVLEDGAAGEATIEAVEPAAITFGIDGLARARGLYYGIRDNQVVRLIPGDPWTTEVLAAGDDFPTTIAIDRTGNVWTVESKFGLLFDGDDGTDAEPPFRIVRHTVY